MESSGAMCDIVDLEPLLRKCLSSDHLKLVEYTVKPLISVGENFASEIMRLDLTIRRNPDAAIEKLHLVAKTMSKTDRPLANWEDVLPKEAFVYTDLIPMYQSIERKAGMKESDLINVTPAFFGHRFSLNDNSSVVDENGLLLMENLKVKGYFNGDKSLGVNVHYAKKTLTAFAKYHALGVIVRHQNPSFFAKVAKHASVIGFDFKELHTTCGLVVEDLKRIPRFQKHMKTIESSFANMSSHMNLFNEGVEPWITVIHGDSWMNNILFHADEEGVIDDVKLVDFQMYCISSPLRDVMRFLSHNLDEETSDKYFDFLIDHYYKEYIKKLKVMGFSITAFSRESFDQEIKSVAVMDFIFYCLSIKYFSHEVKEKAADHSSTVMTEVCDSQTSERGVKRMLQLLTIYERKNWF